MSGQMLRVAVAMGLIFTSLSLSTIATGSAADGDVTTPKETSPPKVVASPRAPRLMKSVPRSKRRVRGGQVVRLRFDSKVGRSSAKIYMDGVRKSRRVRSSGRVGEVTVRLPRNLPEGREVKVVVSGRDPKPWQVSVKYRAGFRLLRGTDGTRVVSGRDRVKGHRGRVIRYTVEVQRGLRRRAPEFLAAATKILGNERRGWTARGARRLKRIDNPRRAHIRLLLAKPRLVDRLCARGGAYTRGIYSCWNYEFAALNLWRWKNGARGFRSIHQYRKYLVNHEFGHGLGYGHVRCRGRGKRAPVMEQQSKSLRGCRANGWPY